MDLYEVSKSGKSITKFNLQASERLRKYKEQQSGRINLYQFETTDWDLIEKIRSSNEMPLFEMNSVADVDVHKRLGQFSIAQDFSYRELKRISTLYCYSLYERISLEKVWNQFLDGNYDHSNLLNVYLGQKDRKDDYCNYLLLPDYYETVHSFDLSGGGNVLLDSSQEMRPTYLVKNILDLPEELAAVEMLEQGRYQAVVDLSLRLDPEALSSYQLVSSELHSIQELKQESMREVANTLDAQKSLLKTIRQSGTWKLPKQGLRK